MRPARKRIGTIVEGLMIPDPITVRVEDSLEQAVELMTKRLSKRLVVTEDTRQVLGIVSRAELVKPFTMN